MHWKRFALAAALAAAPLAATAAPDDPGVIKLEIWVGQDASISGGPIREFLCDDGTLVRLQFVGVLLHKGKGVLRKATGRGEQQASVLWELRQAHPLLDPRLFRNRGFAAGTLTMTVQFFAAFGFFFIVLQYLQYVTGRSARLARSTGLPPTPPFVG